MRCTTSHMIAIAAAAVAACVCHGAAAARGGLIAHWMFDEAGGPTAFDSAGSADLTLSANASFAASQGVSGGALKLDAATNDHAFIGGNLFALNSGDFSIQAWVNLTADTGQGDVMVLSKHQSGGTNGYFMDLPPSGGVRGAPGFYHSGGRTNSTTPINDGAWHQVVAVYNAGANVDLYVDGLPVNSTAATPIANNPSSAFVVGQATGTGPELAFDGLIDEVRIYDHALTGTEVSQLYQSTIPEPSTLVLAALCGLALGGMAWRRRFAK